MTNEREPKKEAIVVIVNNDTSSTLSQSFGRFRSSRCNVTERKSVPGYLLRFTYAALYNYYDYFVTSSSV